MLFHHLSVVSFTLTFISVVVSEGAFSSSDSSKKQSITIQDVVCDGATLRRAILQNEPEFYDLILEEILDISRDHNEDELERALDELCERSSSISATRYLQEEEEVSVSFDQVTQRGYQFDKSYFDGGSSWNVGLFPSGKKNIDAGRIEQIEQSIKSKTVLEWPTDPTNADYATTPVPNFASCDLGVVMCCFTQQQDSVTGANTPMNPTIANADVCHHNMEKSQRASHTENGVTFMTDGRETSEQVNDAYCTGFAWNPADENLNSTSTKYKANTLFYISMLQGFYRNGYVGSVPGSPMCGCIEQMATVTKSSCIRPVDTIHIETTGRNRHRGLQLTSTIEFQPCSSSINGTTNDNVDLFQYYSQMRGTDTEEAVQDIETLASKLVGDGQCPQAVDTVLAKMAYKRGTAWWYADPSIWTSIYGENDLYHPSIYSIGLRRAYEASSTKIIRRVCKSCSKVHHDIYYRRNATETELPPDMDLLTYLTSSWTNVHNEFHVDFDLYSTHEDAVNRQNPWTFCNFDPNRGFPNECGPDGAVSNQWSSTNAASYAKDFAFYIEK